jgi:hypothetical protein
MSVTPTILQDTWSLRLAAVYSDPEYPTDRLPYVYGDIAGGSGGVVYCPCIDTVNYRYLISDAPIVAAPSATIYADSAVVAPADYTLTPDWTDGAGRHVAVVTFIASRAGQRIGYRGKGIKDAGGALIASPLAIAYDLLVRRGVASADIDATSYAQAVAKAAAQGYIAAGALEDDRSLSYTLAELLGPFLAAVVLLPDRTVGFRIEVGGLPADGAVAHHFDRATLSDVTVVYDRSNVINHAAIEYCRNGYDIGLQQEYQARDDGSTTADAASQIAHGAMGPGKTDAAIRARWVRDLTTVRAIQAVMVGLWAQPRALMSFRDDAWRASHLEVGDLAGWSWDWLYDPDGHPLRNQLVTLQRVAPDPRGRMVRCVAMDTGYYMTRAHPADGTILPDGATMAGGDRDRRDYRS